MQSWQGATAAFPLSRSPNLSLEDAPLGGGSYQVFGHGESEFLKEIRGMRDQGAVFEAQESCSAKKTRTEDAAPSEGMLESVALNGMLW